MENLFLDPFVKAHNWTYHWISCVKFYAIYFYYMPNWGLSKDRPLASTTNKAFLKKKKKSGTSLSVSFSAWFLKKYLSCYISLTDQISLSGCLYFVRYCVICVL